jgi:hypothetical protein
MVIFKSFDDDNFGNLRVESTIGPRVSAEQHGSCGVVAGGGGGGGVFVKKTEGFTPPRRPIHPQGSAPHVAPH